MKLANINIGQERTQQNGNKLETTGIYKLPTPEPVHISSLGIKEDFIASKKHHGGPDQAIYVYGTTDYDWWSTELGRDLYPGTFGENLDITELESAQFNIGDRLLIGSVILEITAPRIPCGTLAARMEDPQFVKRFRHAERPGFYCRVIQEGTVEMGNDVKIERYEKETVSVIQIFRDYYDKDKSEETIRKQLNAPIAIRLRTALEEELQRRTVK
ncbi:MAG TPA: MOSC domain-containing protein [Anaerolineales bacterium]|nr:MOSC domain-containing protein [Anaerolineales bacterium]